MASPAWVTGRRRVVSAGAARLINLIAGRIASFVGDGDPTVARSLAKAGGVFTRSLLAYFGEKLKGALDPVVKATLSKYASNQKIFVYIDDLDRGWEGKPIDIRRISALLNALRDMTTDFPGLYFRVALRTDVYFLVRTSDESTDKIDGSVIWYTWTSREIFKILVKRVALFFRRTLEDRQLAGMHQFQMAKILDDVMESKFAGKGRWENAPIYQVLLSLVRNRPRDLVKFCSEAATHARAAGNDLIRTNDLESVFENYSQGRLQDTINEYRTELPSIERLLLGMKPTTLEKKASVGYQYATDALLKKIKQIEEGGKVTFKNCTTASTKDLAVFMYKINFVTARKEASDGEIDRKYFEENRYLLSEFADFGYDWEVHPAYRWALQPNSIDDIFRKLALTKMTP